MEDINGQDDLSAFNNVTSRPLPLDLITRINLFPNFLPLSRVRNLILRYPLFDLANFFSLQIA